MQDLNYFIDSHCHLFNIGDVPILQTIKDKEKLLLHEVHHPLKALLLPTVAFKKKLLDEQLYNFISFFESEISSNLLQVDNSMSEVLTRTHADFSAHQRIITPLLMDFDINGFLNNDNPGKLASQLDNIKREIRKAAVKTIVLPFMGLDPRKFVYSVDSQGHKKIVSSDQIRTNVLVFLNSFNISNLNTHPSPEQSGSIIGIKLYPSLGWDLLPNDTKLLDAYLTVIKEIHSKNIPITVHCQKASFELGIDKEVGNTFTDPAKWLSILSNPVNNLKNLRINFAHFGGEEGVNEIANFRSGDDYTDEQRTYSPNKSGWTHDIIRLLKRYDNTYADLSAFDWRDRHAVASLLWVLHWDGNHQQFDEDGYPNHQLVDKLLWGSDIPMVLDTYSDYKDYFSCFQKAIVKPEELVGSKYTIPEGQDREKYHDLIKKIAYTNPMKFHFNCT